MNDVGRFMSHRVAVASLVAAVALAIVALGATRLISGTDAASLVAAQARTAAFSALEDYKLALGSDDSAAIGRLFTGAALEEMRQRRLHIRQLIAERTDYPGKITLSNVQVLSITGDYATTMTMDVRAHVKQANMKGGRIEDYSESEVDFHIVMVRDGDAWKISELKRQWAPGFSP